MLGILITTLLLIAGARIYKKADSDTYILDLLELGGVYAIFFLSDLSGSVVSLSVIFTICRLSHLIYGVSYYKLARAAQWTLVAEYTWMFVALLQTGHYGTAAGLTAIIIYRMSRWVIENNAFTLEAYGIESGSSSPMRVPGDPKKE